MQCKSLVYQVYVIRMCYSTYLKSLLVRLLSLGTEANLLINRATLSKKKTNSLIKTLPENGATLSDEACYFAFQKNPKQLYLSYKANLGFWDHFGRGVSI